MQWFEPDQSNKLDRLERIALGLMAVITLLTFIGTNIQAVLWQSSDWLVSTVLPAVVVDLTNQERSTIAATPLRRNPVLDEAARLKAEHMAKNSYFAHFAPDGTSPWHFFKTAGYTYAHAGENLAIHFTDSSEVVEAWMKSPAHKENIVNQDFAEIGVGTAKGTFDGYETVFVVQLFGTPAVSPTVPPVVEEVVESESEEVTDTAVDNRLETLAALRAQLEAIERQAATLETPASDPVAEVLAASEPVIEHEVSVEQLPVAEPEYIESDEVIASAEPEPVADVLVIETQLATSSGLAVAYIVEPSIQEAHAGATVTAAAAAATRPNLVLDVVYSVLLGLVLVLLSAALYGEARRFHFVQAAYSLLLLAAVGGLWFAHTALTSGAVVV